jgi:hypothetical protein
MMWNVCVCVCVCVCVAAGGQGQYGRVIGYVEPLPADHPTKFEFVNGMSECVCVCLMVRWVVG